MKLIHSNIFGDFEFATKKYYICLRTKRSPISKFGYSDIEEVYVYPRKKIWFNLFGFSTKNKQQLNKELFAKIFPNPDDMITYYEYFSDDKIDYQIDRLLKLRVFE